MRDRAADLVGVVDVGLSPRTTDYSTNFAKRHLLVRHEVLLTKPSTLQLQKTVLLSVL